MHLLRLIFEFSALLAVSFGQDYKFLYKNGRVQGGFLGHWNEDFKEGLPATVDYDLTNAPNVSIEWIEQKLDHFNGADAKTWSQMYWVNNRFYKPGGPAFLLLGGEGPTARHWIDTNEGVPDWLKNAKQFGALCFQLEHRYYGKSHPTKDMSTENLHWLSSRQALADAAYFIEAMTEKYNLTGAKWITFGGSYSGALSGWFRLKYPHLVAGAVATSAPLLAQVDFKEFLGVVQASLKSYSKTCLREVELGTKEVNRLMQTDEGRQILKTKLKLCDAIDIGKDLDISNLYSTLAGNFMSVVQYSEDNRGAYADTLTIPNICGLMTNPGIPNILDRYAAVNKLILDTNGQKCVSYRYSEMINTMRNTSFDRNDTSSKIRWFSLKQCEDIFGPQFTPDEIYRAVRETNTHYGGLGFKATNVVLPNGSVDPWHYLGLLTSPGPLTEAIYIFGTAHCANMYPPRDQDTAELNLAREEITKQIANWLR